MTPNTPTLDEEAVSELRELPPLAVIDAIDKWVHQQTRFHLSDTDGYQEMLTEVSQAIHSHIQVVIEELDNGIPSIGQVPEHLRTPLRSRMFQLGHQQAYDDIKEYVRDFRAKYLKGEKEV